MHRGDDRFLVLAVHDYMFTDANHRTTLMVALLSDWCAICLRACIFAALPSLTASRPFGSPKRAQ
jgi:hypothetical protein